MSTDWINHIGNWNPQFLRECRGHLKPRSVIAAVGTSVLLQVLLILSQTSVYNDIRISARNIFQILTWTLPYFLLVVGGYYLVNDLAQEEKRGTLNFIRLSPRPAKEILLGKLLGVPILPYLIVLSAVPLHIWATWQAQVSILFLVSYYGLLIATAILCFSLALLTGITHQLRPKQTPASIAFAALGLFLFAPGLMFWNTNLIWHHFENADRAFYLNSSPISISWLYINLTNNSLINHGFVLLNLAIMTGFVWKMLERLFYQPRATLLSKRLSYSLTAYLNVLSWGFFQNNQGWDSITAFALLYGANFALMLLLISTLTPQRQQLFDWLSSHQSNVTTRLWNDKSPAVTAVGVNILIACALMVPWSILIAQAELPLAYLLLMPVSVALSWLTYAAIAQLIFITKVRTPTMWAAGTLILWIFVPLIVLALFQKGNPPAALWMTYRTVFGYPFYEYPQAGFFQAAVVGVGLQSVFLAGLLVLLKQRLDKLRRSVSDPRLPSAQ
ncbi:MAG: hypothetical protein ACFB2W_26930 [Leptolyngbyaceae cyanobacterium]